MPFQFTPFPDLNTRRLRLRGLQESDIAAIQTLRSDPEVTRFLQRDEKDDLSLDGTRKKVQTLMRATREGRSVFWVICQQESDEPLGTICLWNLEEMNRRGELGYELLPSATGNGYMSEALERVMRYGFGEMNLHSMTAWTDAENERSIRLLEKAGFKKEAHFREAVRYDGRFHDLVVYTAFSG